MLLIVSKCFEVLRNQLSAYFENMPLKYQYGFHKGFSKQQCLFLMFEKRKNSDYKREVLGALLTDLATAFQYISHGLLLTKLHAYGLALSALKMVTKIY